MAKTFGDQLAFWCGGFLLVAILSVGYFHIPLIPLLLGGIFAGAVTLMRFWWSQSKSRRR